MSLRAEETSPFAAEQWHSASGELPENLLPQQCEKIVHRPLLALGRRDLSTIRVRPALVPLARTSPIRLATHYVQSADEVRTPGCLTKAMSEFAASHAPRMHSELDAAVASMASHPQQALQ